MSQPEILALEAEDSPSFMPGIMPAFAESEPMAELSAESKYVVEDGILLDPETGEFVGFVAPDGGQITDPNAAPAVDEGFVKWVLRKMLARKSKIKAAEIDKAAAEEANRAIYEAMLDKMARDPEFIANTEIMGCCDKIVETESRALDFFSRRFESMLLHFAKTELGDKKARTWSCSVGSLSVKKKGGKVIVEDHDKLLRWCEINCPDAVKVEKSVLVSKLPEGTKPLADIPAEEGDAPIEGNGLAISSVTEELTITPGAK